MEKERSIGREIKRVSNSLERLFRLWHQKDGITQMQGWFLRYLGESSACGRAVYQRDLEKFFNIRRSTATGILQLMEKNGLILRKSVAEDARLKQILVTEKALRLHAQNEQRAQSMEKRLSEGLGAEELKTFYAVMQRILENVRCIEREFGMPPMPESEQQKGETKC